MNLPLAERFEHADSAARRLEQVGTIPMANAMEFAMNALLAIDATAAKHGGDLLHRGFTIAQVVRDYGGICQAITAIAVETQAQITPGEFQTLNLCLDDAIAGAVTEYGRLRDHESARARRP